MPKGKMPNSPEAGDTDPRVGARKTLKPVGPMSPDTQRKIDSILNGAPTDTSLDNWPNKVPSGASKGDGTGYKKGGMVGSASRRADGIAIKGKTRGKMV